MKGRNFFDQSVENDTGTSEKIRKLATDQQDDCTSGILLDYPCFKESYQFIAIDLCAQQTLDADPKAIKRPNFTGNLTIHAPTLFIFEVKKELFWIFHEEL